MSPIEKIGLTYSKKNLQSQFDGESVTAIEMSAMACAKVDEAIDAVNGVEQTALEATAIVDNMQIAQEAFITANDDTRATLIADNQDFINTLETSKTTFENTMNTALTNFQNSVNSSKTTFETNMTNAVNTIIADADVDITTAVNTKVDTLVNNGTIATIIEAEITDAVSAEIAPLETDVTALKGKFDENDKIYINVKKPPFPLNAIIGDGVADETTKLQAIINYLDTIGGGVCLIPANTIIKFSHLVIPDSNIHLIGVNHTSILLADNVTNRFIEVDQGGIKGTTTYGNSLTNIQIKNLYIKSTFVQTLDVNNNPTTWYDKTAIYLNGARNNSIVEGCKIEGFTTGIYGLFNWLCDYKKNWFQQCKNGIILDGECNVTNIEGNIFRRCGSVADFSGCGLQVVSSYSITVPNNDLELCNCVGFLYEGCQAVTQIGGDLENNDSSIRKIITKGLTGADLATNKDFWTKGVNLIGIRFRNNLGIEFQNGTYGVNVTGCDFTTNSTKNSSFTIRQASGATQIGGINIDATNNYYGDNVTYSHGVLGSFLVSNDVSEKREKYFCLESPQLDVTNANALPIGYFPEKVTITKVQIQAYENHVAGTCTVDLGVGSNVASICLDQAYTAITDVTASPYGLTEVATFTPAQVAGVVRARIQDRVTMTGKIVIRIFYKITF